MRFANISRVFGSHKRRKLREHLAAADRARDARDWPTAFVKYRLFLEASSDSKPGIWVQLGHAAKEMGSMAAAKEAYLKANELMPDDIDIKIQLGHYYKLVGDKAAAVRFYSDAIAKGSRDAHAISFLAGAAAEQAKAPDASLPKITIPGSPNAGPLRPPDSSLSPLTSNAEIILRRYKQSLSVRLS